ncbi:MAG: molybdopterin-dependent oxidoreductase, partial [Thalassotalea sp.]|nr:molybdopterin-dependent oxidoreductase [Thalassotalea sp.]
MKRRAFLKSTLTGAGSLIINFRGVAKDALELSKSSMGFNPCGYIEIKPNNHILLQLTKLEMGQGVGTSYRTLVAEELNTKPELIELESVVYQPSTKALYHKINYAITGGSSSVRAAWQPLREAASATRQLLIQAAIKFWKIQPEQCQFQDGLITNILTQKTLTFGDLIPLAANLPLPKNLQLKLKKDFRFIGKRQNSYLDEAITRGAHHYGIDMTVPNMKYAVIKHCPTISGVISKIEKDAVLAISGVERIVKIPRMALTHKAKKGDPLDDASLREGVAVIATSTWAALNAMKKLNVEWRHSIALHNNQSLQEQSIAMLDKGTAPFLSHGNVELAKVNATSRFSRIYECPYTAHHYMEPLNAIADVNKDKCRLWAGTQSPARDTYAISTALGIHEDNILINVLPTGGAFGRKYNPDFTLEAAYLSQKIGAPVRNLWSREEEISCGQQSDYEVQRFSVTLNEQHEITSYTWQSIISGKWVSELNLYFVHIPNVELSFQRREKTLNLAPWRAVQKARTNLGVECFIDELAYQLKNDPISFRSNLLATEIKLPDLDGNQQWMIETSNNIRPKYLNLLGQVKKLVQWNKPKTKLKGQGRGIAMGYYGGTAILQVVDITMKDNQCIINHITSLVDCGIVVDVS